MKKASSVYGNMNISVESNKIKEKLLADSEILSFLEQNNISPEKFNRQLQVFYNYYISKRNISSIGHVPVLKYVSDEVVLEYSETPEQKKFREEQRWSNRIKTMFIPKSILLSNFLNLSTGEKKVALATELITICDNILNGETVKGLYIYGQTGIGKSYLMGCVYNYLKDKGKEPAIIYFPEFVRKMKASIKTGDYNEIIDIMREQEILIIDDLGAENITEFVRDEILVPIINYRASENLITFFTSNLSIADLSGFLSTTRNTIDETKAMRILDRIRQLAKPVYLEARNERQ